MRGCVVLWKPTPRSSSPVKMSASLAASSGSPRDCRRISASIGVIDSPLAESGIVGTAIGMALRGYRPVCEIQFDGFVFPAFDQIVTQTAKMHNRSAGRLLVPLVIRIPYGGGIGAVEHHSESPEAYFCHTPGLKVVTCSNPVDAYWMIQQAIASDDPIIFWNPSVAITSGPRSMRP